MQCKEYFVETRLFDVLIVFIDNSFIFVSFNGFMAM